MLLHYFKGRRQLNTRYTVSAIETETEMLLGVVDKCLIYGVV